MYLQTQFSIFMVNKPGVLAQILHEVAAAKINIIALTMTDSFEHGVMRLVGANIEKVRGTLQKLNLQFSETDVLCVNLPNQAGALAVITEKLAAQHVNISYAYCTAGARGGKTTGVLKVADVTKAMKILQKKGTAKTAKKTKKTLRRSPAARQ